jgi:hypothetical protein
MTPVFQHRIYYKLPLQKYIYIYIYRYIYFFKLAVKFCDYILLSVEQLGHTLPWMCALC